MLWRKIFAAIVLGLISTAAQAGCERVNDWTQTCTLELGISPLALTGSPGIGITASPKPKCDEGWMLVIPAQSGMSLGQAMCARDLRQPKRGGE